MLALSRLRGPMALREAQSSSFTKDEL